MRSVYTSSYKNFESSFGFLDYDGPAMNTRSRNNSELPSLQKRKSFTDFSYLKPGAFEFDSSYFKPPMTQEKEANEEVFLENYRQNEEDHTSTDSSVEKRQMEPVSADYSAFKPFSLLKETSFPQKKMPFLETPYSLSMLKESLEKQQAKQEPQRKEPLFDSFGVSAASSKSKAIRSLKKLQAKTGNKLKKGEPEGAETRRRNRKNSIGRFDNLLEEWSNPFIPQENSSLESWEGFEDDSKFGHFITSTNGEVLLCNKKCLEIFGNDFELANIFSQKWMPDVSRFYFEKEVGSLLKTRKVFSLAIYSEKVQQKEMEACHKKLKSIYKETEWREIKEFLEAEFISKNLFNFNKLCLKVSFETVPLIITGSNSENQKTLESEAHFGRQIGSALVKRLVQSKHQFGLGVFGIQWKCRVAKKVPDFPYRAMIQSSWDLGHIQKKNQFLCKLEKKYNNFVRPSNHEKEDKTEKMELFIE